MTQHDARTSRWELTSSPGTWVRLGLLALFDALLVAAAPVLVAEESWFLVTASVLVAIVVNWAYFSPRARVLPWLAPGLIFLGLFVAWPILYTAYVSLTNWATGNVLTKDQVITALEDQVITSAGEGADLDLSIYADPLDELAFLLVDPEGEVYFGLPRSRDAEPVDDPLLDVGDVDPTGGGPEAIGDYTKLPIRELFTLGAELEELVLDIPGRGVAQVQTTTQARLIKAGRRYTYDAATDTLYDAQTDETCTVDRGTFVCPDGRRIDPGWRVLVGTENYTNVFSNERIRGPILGVFTWNVVFATLSVLLTFALGLALANALNDDRVRGRALYRSIFILPYAIPGFLSIIIWRGLLNTQFGQVNGLLEVFGIDGIPWLSDGWWAKGAILLVNLWLGFPYMFLITSGALQSVPEELKEAARVDGAGAWRVFRTITLPLLLVSTGPLLIGTFAFNFNNFVLVFLLTNGGPPVAGTEVAVGQTDILISFTFDLAVRSGRGNNFGIASAIVIIIFIVLAIISALSFRATKRLEEVYGNE